MFKIFQVLRNERKFEVDDITFEGMLDRLEQNSGVNAVSAKVILIFQQPNTTTC